MGARTLDYNDGSLTCEGYIADDETRMGKKPCVLVAHAWAGLFDAERESADRLARLGYVGFAVDLYGKGTRGNPSGDNSALMGPFMQDRALVRQRLTAAIAAARQLPQVDGDRIAIIGYCFGGLCAIDLARAAVPGVKGAVSFHGLLKPPNLGAQADISTKILILHGYDDPMAPPEDILAIGKELSAAKADWQLHAYGNTMHAFTMPAANAPERGLKYNAAAARRSWAAMEDFLKEIFG